MSCLELASIADKDTLRRAAKHIEYVDAGTSGGIWGLEQGYSLMLGRAAQVIEQLRPLFTARV